MKIEIKHKKTKITFYQDGRSGSFVDIINTLSSMGDLINKIKDDDSIVVGKLTTDKIETLK